jgi:cellulose synthase/poly-beta-1,6-N-acetylglucosamine synthase-like glycosyltransferase
MFKEKKEDLEMTLTSVASQTYPRDKIEVILIVEPGDDQTSKHASEALPRLKALGIESRIMVSDGKPKMKPRALNVALREVENEFVCVYDAADLIEKDQIEQAISLMLAGKYDVVQAKVYRKGPSILSRLLLLDTFFWYNKYLPMVARLAGGFPLSGEGLFLRKSVLAEVGYFPEMLTEDACLGLELVAEGKRFGLLESAVIEKAPRNARAHFRQRLRWYRGYLTCFRRLIRTRMSIKTKLTFSLVFGAPLVGALAFVSWLLCLVHWCLGLLVPGLEFVASWMPHSVYVNVLYYWCLGLLVLGPLIGLLSYLSVIPPQERHQLAPLVCLIPLYWLFVNTCATSALFQNVNCWYKTER